MDLFYAVSKIEGNICKIFILVFYAPAEGGSPWNFVTVVGLEKLYHQKSVTIYPFI